MPEAATVDAPVTTTATTTTANNGGDAQSLGWRAGLPDDLKQNTDLVNYKTVGDFTKDALSWKTKASELETKLSDYVPKLPDDATEEDRNVYLDAIGRPSKPDEYELDGEDKNAPDQLKPWKQDFYEEGLTKQQALNISKKYNARINKLVDDYKANLAKEATAAEQALRTEMGDKYDTNVELAKRLYTKHLTTEFDADFADAPPKARFGMVKLLLKVASLTGEDTSPTAAQGGKPTKVDGTAGWLNMYNNPKPGVVSGRK